MYLDVTEHPRLALGTIAAIGLFMAFSPEEEVLYTSVDKCLASGVYPKACQAASEDASQHHLATAPKFRNMVACEMEYGAGNCSELRQNLNSNNATGTSVFAPSPAGFVMPRSIENFADYSEYRRRQQNSKSGSSGAMSAYRKRNGDLVTPDVSASEQNGGSFGGGPGGALASDVKTLNAKTNVKGRGGFGGHSFSGS
ncbi:MULTISPECIES: DUF1190 domain-containing protein [Agrobacterium tumefaciens complex]|uniref:DUF1190 domain-containing protein n=1 Tax=Agrobacterium tumefaciens complex TaxID=1183400 RepID=UPI000DD81629|nr:MULTISPECIES: DUF1190 domain-containing protein [Agrobacterium tumefaciens complex]MBB4406337.1 uncharacterized protein YgiB involved in biofilm formation [Agrobacterium radiobacter]MBB4450254.1 uncharacterized protein YgiB involved in biofilm formation [Agrobacterium radiobacter]MDR6589642.1 uncharacterized protein YgiB involved in biofilm formation [Agrobacterium tumefaciens]